jgi:ATP synthase regulation protein NCA2
MMNALHAMDDMLSANDINMNLAAITPAVLLVYASTRVFRFFFYALLKLGKSREETYASFRHVLTDIERLLVMRDNPPPTHSKYGDQPSGTMNKPCVLGSDDLGMLMLLVHECRSILWRDRKRFSEGIIRSVSEDLAELAGERGELEHR